MGQLSQQAPRIQEALLAGTMSNQSVGACLPRSHSASKRGGGSIMQARALDYAMHNYAQLCTIMHNYAQLRTSMHNYAELCTSMHIHAHICTIMHNYAQLCTSMHKYAQLCTSMHKYAQLCRIMHKYAHTCTYMHIYAQLCTILHNYAQLCTCIIFPPMPQAYTIHPSILPPPKNHKTKNRFSIL